MTETAESFQFKLTIVIKGLNVLLYNTHSDGGTGATGASCAGGTLGSLTTKYYSGQPKDTALTTYSFAQNHPDTKKVP